MDSRLQSAASGGLAFPPLFSPGGDHLAVGGSDGVVRIYDAGTGHLKATLGAADGKANALGINGHLVEKHTCAAWASAARKKKKSSSWSLRFLVGTAQGDVKAFDPQLGELVWRAQACVAGGVLALAHSSHRPGVILASGASGQLVSLSMETGEVVATSHASKHPISCLAVSSDASHVFGGGTTLSLWQQSGQQCERAGKYTGHTGPACSAVFAPDGRAAASASPDERHVAVWLTAPRPADGPLPAKKRKGLQAAAATLAMQQPPVQLDACADPEQPQLANGNGAAHGRPGAEEASQQQQGPGAFCLCAISTAGDAYVWRCGGGGGAQPAAEAVAGGEGLQGSLVAHICTPTHTHGRGGLSDRILAARLLAGSAGLSLLVARGSTARPVFETLSLSALSAGQSRGGASVSQDGATLRVTLAPLTSGALFQQGAAAAAGGEGGQQQAGRAKRAGGPVAVVGPAGAPGGDHDMQTVTVMRTANVVAAAAAKQQRPLAGLGVEEEDDDEDEEEEEEGEALRPLAERVAALAVAAGVAAPASQDPAPPPLPQGADKAGSMAVLLTQALRSNDRELLERCLSSGASTSSLAAAATVSRLLPLDAAALLRACVDRLLGTPGRAAQLAPWIKATLHHHTGYLMSAPAAQAPLAALYQALDARVATYGQLLRLHGRLTLVTAHSAARQQRAAGGGGALGGAEVVLADEDDDEGEEEGEEEDPFAVGLLQGGSDGGEEDEGDEGPRANGWGAGGGSDEDDDGDLLHDDDDEEDDEDEEGEEEDL